MKSLKRVRTPLRRHLHRLRMQFVPVVVFVACTAGAVHLWGRHTGQYTLIGEAEAIHYDVASPVAGFLIELPGGVAEPLARIRAGQIVARLDDRPVLSDLEILRAEVGRLEFELVAADARARQADADRRHDSMDQTRRLAVDRERTRMDVLDRETRVETDRVLLRRLEVERDALFETQRRDAATAIEIELIVLQCEEVARGLAVEQTGLAQARAHLVAATQRLEDQPAAAAVMLDEILSPIRSEIDVWETRMRQLRLQAESLVLRAPDDGAISAVMLRPGQTVQAGRPILTIAADESDFISVHVRNHQRLPLRIGASVEVVRRTTPPERAESRIERIGVSVEPVPAHQLRDASAPEWGLPVRIAMPDDLDLDPSELVDIVLLRSSS